MKVTFVYSHTRGFSTIKQAEPLSEYGHQVKLLMWDRDKTEKVENGKTYTTHLFSFKAPHDRLSVLFYLPIWWTYEFLFLMRDSPNVVHAHNLDTLIPAIPVKLIKRVKLCYTIDDFYADILPAVSPLIPRIVQKAVASLEKFLIRFTDVLVLFHEARYEQVKGARIKKLVYIYNSPPDYFNTRDNMKPPKSGSESETTIFYAGHIYKSRGLEHMVKAVEDLDNVRLILVGKGPDIEFIEESARRCPRIQYSGQPLSYEDVLKKTLETDILFRFGDPKIPNSKYNVPNKLYEAMMCGRPIIVNDGVLMSDIVRRERCGLVVPYGDVAAIKEAVLKLKNDPELCRTLGRNGRKAYEERYGWEIMKDRLIKTYDEMAKS